MKARAAALALAAAAVALPAGGARAQVEDCEWLAGDLHVHTTYSHDSYGGPTDDNTGPEEAYTLGHSVTSQFAVAASRQLDYLAITDHNDIRSQADAGFGEFGVIPIGGYENSLDGHAQMLGAHEIYDNGDDSPAAVQRIADKLRADGGAFQVNHPAEGSTDFPNDADWTYLYEVQPDTVEVWNISRLWQPPMPSGSSNDDAIRYWEGWLDRGARVAATGGSDNHYLATTAVQGVGQPTTWVCASTSDESGVLQGLRNGRTFVSHQPPAYGGPRIFLEGDPDGDGTYDALVGDEVPAGSDLRVRVENGAGSFLSVIADGGTPAFEPIAVTAPSFTHEFRLDDAATWVRAEIFDPDLAAERESACDEAFGTQTTYCRNRLLVLAMTSALYLAPEDAFDPTTTLVYDGNRSARAGDTATFAATLAGTDGPVAGALVTFDFRDRSYDAVTDDAGRAVVEVRVAGPPGTYDVGSSFAGSDRYSPSQDLDAFAVTTGRP